MAAGRWPISTHEKGVKFRSTQPEAGIGGRKILLGPNRMAFYCFGKTGTESGRLNQLGSPFFQFRQDVSDRRSSGIGP